MEKTKNLNISTLLTNLRLAKEMKKIRKTEILLWHQLEKIERYRRLAPIQCDLLAKHLEELGNLSNEICQLFRNHATFTISINSYHYLLLNNLYGVQELASQLREFVLAFRPVCLHSRKDTRRSIKEINDDLSEIIELLKESKMRSSIIFDQYHDKNNIYYN